MLKIPKTGEGQILIALYKMLKHFQSQCDGYQEKTLCFSYLNLDRDTACTNTQHIPVATCYPPKGKLPGKWIEWMLESMLKDRTITLYTSCRQNEHKQKGNSKKAATAELLATNLLADMGGKEHRH